MWAAEPFADDAAFAAKVNEVAGTFGVDAAPIIAATKSPVGGPDNSCNTRVALTFDDGPSFYRAARRSRALRAAGVPVTFFDTGMRLDANPQLTRAELAEGHTVLLHTWDHPNLGSIPANILSFEVTDTAARFDAARRAAHVQGPAPAVPERHRGHHGGDRRARLHRHAEPDLGHRLGPGALGRADPRRDRRRAAPGRGDPASRRPGRLARGPGDGRLGAADHRRRARQRGYCFGTVDKAGQVVANRYVSSGIAIPTVTAPVPYLPLAYAGTPPAPSVTVPQPLRITATHSPAVFVRGDVGTLTLTINNPTDGATDGSTTTVTQALPAGLTSTGATGTGWTCTGTTNLTCTRNDVLPAGGRSRRSMSACAWRPPRLRC